MVRDRRNYNGQVALRTPEDLIRFWYGHARKSITDSYSKLDQDLKHRLEVAETVGLGFDVPASMTPLTPQKC